MATDMNVTFQQFVAECAKCRVLCQFSHRIWTRKQVAALVKARLELEVSNNQSLKTIDDSIDRLEAEITRSENEDNEWSRAAIRNATKFGRVWNNLIYNNASCYK